MIQVIGHRGAAAYEPENTLRSFRRALEIGVHAVELDVHLSKDGRVVVIHDPTVDRTTNGHGYVRDLSFEDLSKLDAGMGERIPLLEEVIDLVKDKAILQIELKGEGTEEPVLRILEEKGFLDRVVLTSFFHNRVKKAKELKPLIKTGVLFVGRPLDPIHIVRVAKADAIHINYLTVDKELVEEIHRAGIKVTVWNVDEPRNIDRMIDFGVDAIGSNKPDIVLSCLKAKKMTSN
ncbi:glycerophosphodiester phosphodiesterase [Candidatus Bathyarchaeota archaeon]|nr:glycerophosphodiester phosphodiesterase [Candidatus Bathyarchaeota archaeon]